MYVSKMFRSENNRWFEVREVVMKTFPTKRTIINSYIQIFKALKSCHRHNRNIGNCLPVLQKRGMIGKGHVFKKYGYGYGLGVTFVL
jgi:hypothetical protein